MLLFCDLFCQIWMYRLNSNNNKVTVETQETQNIMKIFLNIEKACVNPAEGVMFYTNKHCYQNLSLIKFYILLKAQELRVIYFMFPLWNKKHLKLKFKNLNFNFFSKVCTFPTFPSEESYLLYLSLSHI